LRRGSLQSDLPLQEKRNLLYHPQRDLGWLPGIRTVQQAGQHVHLLLLWRWAVPERLRRNTCKKSTFHLPRYRQLGQLRKDPSTHRYALSGLEETRSDLISLTGVYHSYL